MSDKKLNEWQMKANPEPVAVTNPPKPQQHHGARGFALFRKDMMAKFPSATSPVEVGNLIAEEWNKASPGRSQNWLSALYWKQGPVL